MTRVLQFLINDDPRLTLTYFTARSKAWNVIGSCMCNLVKQLWGRCLQTVVICIL